jgi:hypothetical protein
MNQGDWATTTTVTGDTVAVKLRARKDADNWTVRSAEGLLTTVPETRLSPLSEPPFAFRFLSLASERTARSVRLCLLCREECEQAFECNACGQGWCSERCRDLALSAGHTSLCALQCTTATFKTPVSQGLRLITRSFPALPGGAGDVVRRICALGVFENSAGAYFTTNTPSRRAGFVNLQPLAALREFECDGDVVRGTQSTMREGLRMSVVCVSGMLEMRVCVPTLVLFAAYGGRMEMCEVQPLPTSRFVDHGIDRLKLDWRTSTFVVRVYDIVDGQVSTLLRSAKPVVLDAVWRAAMEEEFAAATEPGNVNLGATEWSPESCQLVDIDSVRTIEWRMRAASTEEEYMAATNTAIDALNVTLSTAFVRMLQMEDVDFFLFPCHANSIVPRSQTHATFDTDVVPVRMTAPTEHQRRNLSTYAQWFQTRCDLLERCGPGVVVIFEIRRCRFDARSKYFMAARHWSRDLLAPTTHTSSSTYERHVVQGKMDLCDVCHTASIRLLRCSNCKRARYCSRTCQKAHWSAHRTACAAMVRERRAATLIQARARGARARRVRVSGRWARSAVVVQAAWRGARQRRHGHLALLLRAMQPWLPSARAAGEAMVLAFWQSKTEADANQQGVHRVDCALLRIGLPPLRALRCNPCDATHDLGSQIDTIRQGRWRSGAIHWSEKDHELTRQAPLLAGVAPAGHSRPWMYSGEPTTSQRRRARQRRRLVTATTPSDAATATAPRVPDPDEDTCVICLDRPRTHGLLHVGAASTMHLCVCEECAATLGSACPLCRQTIAMCVRVHN